MQFQQYLTSQTQDVNWTHIRRSEDVSDVFWTSYVLSVYVLCLRGDFRKVQREKMFR